MTERSAFSSVPKVSGKEMKKKGKKKREAAVGRRWLSTPNQIHGHITAEMTTVLRNTATIIIRLREKLKVQRCAVFVRLEMQSS